MKYAAGIMFMAPDNDVLMLKRGDGGDHPGEWNFPGGTTEEGETTEQTAVRECKEELGFVPRGDKRIRLAQTVMDDVNYTTFIQHVETKFAPQLNGEHTGWAWVRPSAPPLPIHPGCQVALNRLVMNELDIARAIRDGELVSPQKYENVWLFALRITGTGAAYRGALNEFVMRDKAYYLNDEFLARCNGLAVIWEHPKTVTLTSKEFNDRNIGAIMLPYIKDDDVWGIAKIYDAGSAKEMEDGQLSTSPCVKFDENSGNVKRTLPDGSTLLHEGDPKLLDHLAVCTLGVWDKYGPPTGVLNETLRILERADSMSTPQSPEELAALLAANAKASADAAAKSFADSMAPFMAQVSSTLANLTARADAADKARADAEEKEKEEKADKAKADKAKADEEAEMADKAKADRAKADAEEHDKWEKEDAEQCAKDDSEEEKEREEMEKKGETKEAAADKARKSRRDRADARRKDSEEKMEKEKADRATADATGKTVDELRAKIAMLEAREAPLSSEDMAAFADAQADADKVYMAHGQRAAPPMKGEALGDYKLRMALPFQRYSEKWKTFDLRSMAANVRDSVIIPEVFADALIASHSPTDIPSGQLRPIHMTDPATGIRRTEFRGAPGETFIAQMRRPSRRVKGWSDKVTGG